MSLERFLEPIQVADEPIGEEYKAYKMDATNPPARNMRHLVSLGTCHCCDYFLIKGNTVIFIEETRLLKRIRNIKNEYNYLDDEDMDKIVKKKLQERMQMKAYGAMLVLTRLALQCPFVQELIQNCKYSFWLLPSVTEWDEDEMRAYDNILISLKESISGVLGKELLEQVDIQSPKTIKENYPI